jgi:hypothetical protein
MEEGEGGGGEEGGSAGNERQRTEKRISMSRHGPSMGESGKKGSSL